MCCFPILADCGLQVESIDLDQAYIDPSLEQSYLDVDVEILVFASSDFDENGEGRPSTANMLNNMKCNANWWY